MADRVIFHIDVNSAFLSWSAAYRVNVLGESIDLRMIPSVVAGDRAFRHSIILAKVSLQRNTVFRPVNRCSNLWKNVRTWWWYRRIIPCMWRHPGILSPFCGSFVPV